MTILRPYYSDYYLPWCIQQNIEPVLEHTYRKNFSLEYNIVLNYQNRTPAELVNNSILK